MTEKQINEMTPRQLDAAIAEYVMQWTRYPKQMHPTDNRTIDGVLYCPPDYPFDMNAANCVPYYSDLIAAAWLVVEKLADDGRLVIVKADGLRSGDFNPRYTVLIDNERRVDDQSAARGICRAALRTAQAEGK